MNDWDSGEAASGVDDGGDKCLRSSGPDDVEEGGQVRDEGLLQKYVGGSERVGVSSVLGDTRVTALAFGTLPAKSSPPGECLGVEARQCADDRVQTGNVGVSGTDVVDACESSWNKEVFASYSHAADLTNRHSGPIGLHETPPGGSRRDEVEDVWNGVVRVNVVVGALVVAADGMTHVMGDTECSAYRTVDHRELRVETWHW